MGVAKFGEPMVHTEFYGPDLGPDVHVGLFACSHNPKVKETATFTNVRIVVPPKAGWVPYRDYIGSNLEVHGRRDRAPHGAAHVADLDPGAELDQRRQDADLQRQRQAVDVRPRDQGRDASSTRARSTRNNNDHVLSFDGTMMGISSASQDPADDNRSVIYVLPATGGEPKRVTPNSPSYLHGWSLDKKWLFYTGQRNNELDSTRSPSTAARKSG